MDPGLVIRGLVAGSLSALLLAPLILGWLPASVEPAWPYAAPLHLSLLLAALSPGLLLWAGARAAKHATSRRDATIRGAFSGALAGVPLFLWAGTPAAAVLGCSPVLDALADGPLPGAALGVRLLQALERLFAVGTASWLGLPALGASLGAVGARLATNATQEWGSADAPTLAPFELSCGLLIIEFQSAVVAASLSVALPKLVTSSNDFATFWAEHGGTDRFDTWSILAPFWCVLGCCALAFLGLLRGVRMRQGAATARGWDRALSVAATVVWCLMLAVFGLIAPTLLRSPLTLAIVAATFASAIFIWKNTRAAPAPPRTGRSLIAWILSTGALSAWVLSLGIALGLSAGLGIIGAIPYLNEGGAPQGFGVATLDETLRKLLAFHAILFYGSLGGQAIWVGIPLGAGLVFARRLRET